MTTFAEIREEYFAKSKALDDIFVQAGAEMDMSKVTLLEGDSVAKAAEIKRRNDELTEIGIRFEKARADEEMVKANRQRVADLSTPTVPVIHPGLVNGKSGGALEPISRKSLGEMFTEAPAYKANKGDTRPFFVVNFSDLDPAELKTVMSLTAGYAQEVRRGPRLVFTAQRRPVVADLIPQSTTTENSIRFMEETTFTNNAAPVAEGAAKPEAALVYTERSQPVEVIAVTLPVTNQQLDDVPQIRGIVNDRLTLMVELAEETQLLTGSGTSPALLGFYNKAGISTQAKGTDPTPDAIYKAFTKVRFTAFAEPSAVVIHPNDWQDIRLLRTADGVYIWGSPAEDGPGGIWGKPVIVTTAATEGTGLTGDFQLFSHISRRMGLRIDVSTEHSDFFLKNQVLIRAEERLSLEIYRAAAFATITGI